MGGKSTINNSETRIEALKLQSSAYGVTLPVVGGTARIPGNLIYYTDFKATPHTSTDDAGGKGGGVKTTNTTYTYSASVIMGLAEGPVQGLRSIWVGKKRYDSRWVQPQIKTYVETTNVVTGATYTCANVQNFSLVSIVVRGFGEFGTLEDVAVLAEGVHFRCDAATGKITWLAGTIDDEEGFAVFFFRRNQTIANPYSGQQVRITYTSMTSGYSESAAAQLGVSLVNGYLGQAAPAWVQALHPAEALGYSFQAYVHAQDYQLGGGAQVENHTFEVIGFGAYSISPSIPDCNPADFTRSILLDARYGARMPAEALDPFTTWSDYCLAAGIVLSPALTEQLSAADFVTRICRLTNSAPIWSVNRLKIVPYGDQALAGNGASYTPNLTPIYDLDDDHFLQEGSEPPVRVNRNGRADRYNNVKLQFNNRANYYNNEVVEVKDDADVQVYGLRTMSDLPGEWICEVSVARTVAQLVMQRSLNVAAEYEFRLPWAYCLLEPMDLLTITDLDLGLDHAAVRITEISESDDGELLFKAESFPQGVASAVLYPSQASQGYRHNYNATPLSALPPKIFEAPTARTASGLGVYLATCGQSDDWGGCRVWVSLDGGVNFKAIGTINGGARVGKLTAPIAAGDVSVSIALEGHAAAINNASAAAAARNQALVWIDGPQGGEYMNFVGALLTGADVYTLSGLVRGAYGNPANAHERDATFVRVDDAVVLYELELGYLGQPLQFKLTSFNVFGAGEESLADVPAYAYTVSGAQLALPPATPTGLQVADDRLLWNPVQDSDVAGYRVRMHFGIKTDWGTALPMHEGLVTTTPFQLPYKVTKTVTFLVKAVDVLGNESATAQSAIANLGDAIVDNVWESFTHEGPSAWTGTVTNGTAGATLQADAATLYWTAAPESAFWGSPSSPFWPATLWKELAYTFDVIPTASGRLLLEYTASGDSAYLEYLRGDQRSFWGSDTGALFWKSTLTDPYWPDFTPSWQPWLGALSLTSADLVTFRLSIAGGPNRGTITQVVAKLDVPDIVENVSGIVVAPGGARLPVTKGFRVIKNVSPSLRDASSGGISIVIDDKDPTLGPLVRVLDSGNSSVLGIVDATIQGY